MSRLDPSVIALDKGLNLQTAKILAPAGSALSSLNYEQVDFQGQKRIEGYTRYDGNVLSAIDEYYLVSISDVTIIEELEGYGLSDVYVGNKFLGKAVAPGSVYLYVAVYDFKLLETLSYIPGKEYDSNPEDHYENLLQFNSQLRQNVEKLPGAVSGLHWFNDRLYAVADVATVQLEGTGLYGIQPNVMLEDVYGYVPARLILDVVEYDGNTLVFLSGGDIADWRDAGVEWVTYEGASCSQYRVISYSPSVPINSYPASIFEARTEVQASTEDGSIYDADYGWKFNHLGWEVQFKNGYVPYGDLAALNQNRQGVGIEGPTSISGSDGRPLNVKQKMAIKGTVQQVNGWKTSNTPTSYNLDPLAIKDKDGTYIYADAYVEWSDEGGIITPDITNLELQERAPSSSVPVEDI